MAKKKQQPIEPEGEPEDFEFEDFEKMEKPKVEEFMEIGGSPVPGITLRHVLRGHTQPIKRIAWSPDGQYLASPSQDGTIRIWDVEQEKSVAVLEEQLKKGFVSVTWSPDSLLIASGGSEGQAIIWDIKTKKPFQILSGHNGFVHMAAWSPNGQLLATGGSDESIRIWNTQSWKLKQLLQKEFKAVWVGAWSADSRFLAFAGGNNDSHIRLWDANSNRITLTLGEHGRSVNGLEWSPIKNLLITCADDKTIRAWDLEKGTTQILEGHTDWISSVAFSADGRIISSKASDGTVRLWSAETLELANLLGELSSSVDWDSHLDFHPYLPRLATLGKQNTLIRIWDIDYDVLINNKLAVESIRYTTAKLVLVGDSGVGKTGLGWRLAHNEFKEHSSTHGQQFWVVPELKKTRDDGTECEAVLWDLAGQPDYRLVHSLYLDDVDTAMILFDPSNRQEPLAGVDFWLNQLKDKDKKLRNSILVGARTDRGTSTLTDAELEAFCERNGITGGYIPTSAIKGDGLPELMERLKAQIPWDQMTTTVTTVTFKRIKEFVLALKEKTERKNVLVKPGELRDQLQATDKDWEFSDAEMMTAVGHLGTHGYVKIIHNSNGQHSILLAPDIMANLASSIVLEARRNPRGLGVLEEERLLRGEYPFAELNNLREDESKILLDAVAVLFLERNLCFRETFNQQTFLVFPSLINEKRPVDESLKIEEGASYRVKGAVENIYASLVVLLGYTNTFTRINQWQNQAQYEMGEGEICGFQQSEYRNGEIELVLYYDQKTPDPVRLTFRGLFERFLSRRELEISRYQPVICHKCGAPLARNVVMDQLSKRKDFSFCHECGERLQLPNPEPVSRLSRREEVIVDVQQAIAQRRTAFEAALVRVKGLLRDQNKEKIPTCFISYAWGTSEHQRWVMQLAKDLRNSGIEVLLDRWNVKPGDNLSRYIEQIMTTDYVVVVGTPGLLQKYNSTTSDPVVTAELDMLNLRLSQPNKYGHTILPILVEGDSDLAFSPQLRKLVYIDFKQSAFYFRQLFDMIWRLYDLSLDNPLLEELQESMSPQQA